VHQPCQRLTSYFTVRHSYRAIRSLDVCLRQPAPPGTMLGPGGCRGGGFGPESFAPRPRDGRTAPKGAVVVSGDAEGPSRHASQPLRLPVPVVRPLFVGRVLVEAEAAPRHDKQQIAKPG
jgi:hypothetical protein